MWKRVVGALCVTSVLYGAVLTPERFIEAGGNVIDVVVKEGKIIAGTDAGTLEVYDFETGVLQKAFQMTPIEDFMGNPMPAKVFSIDKIANMERYLVLAQSPTSYREVFIIQDGKQRKIIDTADRLMIKKAKFIAPQVILLGLLSNELVLFDIEKEAIEYRFQLTQSHFSDFALSKDKTLVPTTDESGKVHLVDVKRGKVMQTFKGGNVDNVYKLDMEEERILTAGQDRRGILYERTTGKFDRYDAEFLIYACALSPSAKLGALPPTEQNENAIYDVDTKRQLHLLRGQKTTLNTIVFVDEKTLVSSSDDKFIMIWSIP
jgi:WD40 repeat protein